MNCPQCGVKVQQVLTEKGDLITINVNHETGWKPDKSNKKDIRYKMDRIQFSHYKTCEFKNTGRPKKY